MSAVAEDIAGHRPVAVATSDLAVSIPSGWDAGSWSDRTQRTGRSAGRGPTPRSRTMPRLLAAGRSEVLTYGPDGVSAAARA